MQQSQLRGKMWSLAISVLCRISSQAQSWLFSSWLPKAQSHTSQPLNSTLAGNVQPFLGCRSGKTWPYIKQSSGQPSWYRCPQSFLRSQMKQNLSDGLQTHKDNLTRVPTVQEVFQWLVHSAVYRAVTDTLWLVAERNFFSNCFKKPWTDGQRTGRHLLRLLLSIWRRRGRCLSQRCQWEQFYLQVE